MEQAAAGHGSIVLIRGEPGVGKTRLAQELILEARKHGMFDSTGRCYEMEGAPPYIPYIEMLQQSLRRGPAGFRTAWASSYVASFSINGETSAIHTYTARSRCLPSRPCGRA